MEAKACLNLVFLRTKRAEKSASGIAIQGQQPLKSKKSSKFTVSGCPVTVYDTPALSDTDMSEEEIRQIYEKVLQECESGPCVFLLVIKADRFSEEERKTVEKIEKLLGEKRLEKTWILFNGGDELEEKNKTIKEFIDDSEPLKKFVQKYNQRYHVFNNKSKEYEEQFKILLFKMIQIYSGLKASEGGRLLRRIPAIKNNASVSSVSSRRIVLLGKTGVGKSAAGNTILGKKEFRSAMRARSVTSKCSVAHATVSDRSVSVVDTPGFFDTEMKFEELMMEIARSIYISSPGPHAFLIVLRVNDRYTEHEQLIPQMIEIMFGQEVLKYSIILFTHGDMLKKTPLEEVIKDSAKLRHLVDQCGGRYHVFNNEDENNREQVNDLLQKIDTMIEQNGGGHYSNQMYEDAERFRREEEEQRQREEEERRQREEEERRQREEEQRKQNEKQILEFKRMLENAEAQRATGFDAFSKQYEQRFSFSAFLMSKLKNIGVGALIGAAAGGIVGVIAGPAGVAAGVALGAACGATAGAAIDAFFRS